KSRNGCQQCKRRHRKCDETRPSCVNCRTSKQYCSYLTTTARRPRASTFTEPVSVSRPGLLRTDLLSGPLDAISVGAAYHVSPSRSNALEEPIFTMRHMELLHHFRTHLLHHPPTSMAQGLQMDDYFDLAIRQGFHAPWLMQQILAVSASHLSYLQNDRQYSRRSEATLLQMRGLNLLNRAESGLSAAEGLPAYFFSVFISLQTMVETLSARCPLPELLTRLVAWFRLARGIAVFIDRYSGELPLRMQEPDSAGREDHQGIISDCDRGRPLKWAIVAPPEYAQLAEQRSPYALLVLAHYGFLLHRARHYWAVGDSGQFIVQSITQYLGLEWAELLAW
ncbi:hypothetical protein GQ53DRAFT_618115, partial [Thozetella sp. PMI_491]